MSKLYIVRHGEIDFNVEGRYAGAVDVPLNERGIQQARDLVTEISKLNINLIISSPLNRCVRMAEILNETINSKIIIMDEFRERNVGVYEGLTKEEAKNKYPELWAKNITRIYHDAPTGGETIQEVENRVFSGLNKIKEERVNQDILIVMHGFVGKMIHKFFHSLTQEQFFEYKLDNAKIIEYELL